MGVDYLLEFTIHISISQVTQTHTQTNKQTYPPFFRSARYVIQFSLLSRWAAFQGDNKHS